MLKTEDNPAVFLKDYQPPEFKLHSCELDFKLDAERTEVTARYQVEALGDNRQLRLDGEALTLLEVMIDGTPLSKDQYQLDEKYLQLDPDSEQSAQVKEILNALKQS